MTNDYAEPLTHIGNSVDHLTKALADRKWDEAAEIAERMHQEMVKVRAWINWRKHGSQSEAKQEASRPGRMGGD